MIKYEVGKQFPHEKYLNRGELTVSILNETFFDVLVCLHGITSDETKAFRKGKLTAGIFEYKSIPFIIFDLGDGFSFDVSIDITKISEEQQNMWLNSNSNTINMFLVDASNGELKAIRMISVNFADEIRDILEEQTGLPINEVQSRISMSLQLIDTNIMLNNLKKKMEFK